VESLRVAWFNWRCIRHPLAGGAEVYTHEIARRMVRRGHEVVLVTSRFKGLPKEEVVNGYRVVRSGNRYTVYLRARRVYRELRRCGWRPDVVVDEVNTIPFLTPRWVGEPVVMLIHQLCRECWAYSVHPLVKPFGWWLERRFHREYVESLGDGRLRAVVTVSPSTRRDLLELGYPEDKVYIDYNGLDSDFYDGHVDP